MSESYDKLRKQYDDINGRQESKVIVEAYNRGVDDAKDAVRLEGSDKWEGAEFKPYFITAIARYCGSNRAKGSECDACEKIVNETLASRAGTVSSKRLC